MRQQYTAYERDAETGLDFAQARYYAAAQGRFTSPDPLAGSMMTGDPQSFNRYAYVSNGPTNSTDPTGLDKLDAASEQRSANWAMSQSHGVPSGAGNLDREFDYDLNPEGLRAGPGANAKLG